MMMENRSYDHLFGARKMIEGLAGNGLTQGTTLLDVNDQPVGLWEPNLDQECDLDPPHGWDALRASFNGGRCDGFVKTHQMEHENPTAIEPMQYLTRTQVPVSYALADAYTSCDNWFCSVMGPTWPNRFYWHAGTSFGEMVNALPTSLSPSIYHRLVAKNVDWGYYYGNIPVVGVINDFDVTPFIHHFSDFLDDAARGTLPPVVYIDPGFNANDDHPPVHPINGQALIAAVYKALATSPQWPNCQLLITYDENGGFYDHVPPPLAPDDMAAIGFNQLGFRVPTMVIGPYAKQSYVSSVQFDHTSALKHIQNTFGLDRLTMRTDAATDIDDCVDQERLEANDPSDPIDLPAIDLSQWPMSSACTSGDFKEAHPVIAWADANRERLGSLDLRGTERDMLTMIDNYLGSKPRAKVR